MFNFDLNYINLRVKFEWFDIVDTVNFRNLIIRERWNAVSNM